MRDLRYAGPLALVAIGLSVSPAEAATKIGGATLVERDVRGALPGQERKVAQGDDVFLDEMIRTAAASAAKLKFVDDTDISLGPQAAVKLDRFVFRDERSAKDMIVTVTKGAMRWVSGISPSAAYEIKTPNAIIGVRGTIFELAVTARRTSVVLQEGEIQVCTASRPRRCKTLKRRGDMLTVAGGAIQGPRAGGPGASDFARSCLSAASKGCTLTASADPSPPQARRWLAQTPPDIERPIRRPRTRIERAGPPPIDDPIIDEEIVPTRHYPIGVRRPWPVYHRPIRVRPPGIRFPSYPPNRGIGIGHYPNDRGGRLGWSGGRGFGTGASGQMGGRGFGGRFMR